MIGYSSITSIVFVTFGILYGVGFLVLAWMLVQRLSQKKEPSESSGAPGTYEPQGLIATPVAAVAATPSKADDQPSGPKSKAKEVPSEPIDINTGFDGGIDGGGF